MLGNTGGLVKAGNTFVGWNTQADGSGTTYASQATFVMGSANITLYARWTALPTYTVTYDGNVNTGGTAPVDANSYLQGQTVTTRGAGTLVKTGYTFTGWNTKANGSGTAYAAGVTFAMGAANDTLHAQWALVPTYGVAYNGNTNTTGAAPADNNRYTVGQSVIALGNTGNLAKPGYTFVGWNTQANDSGIGYATGVSFFMGSSNVTLYAQWTQLPTYTVTYDGNGSTGGSVPLDANNYLSGATVTVPDNPGGLVKTGNAFIGWNTKTDGSGTTYTSLATFTMGSANITLYARWTSNPTYKVTYDGNGSLGGTAPADANSYLQGQTVTTLSAGSLARPNYIFTGWNTLANGEGLGYGVGVTFAMPSNNVTLFAQWTGIPTYTVTYNGNGNNAGTAPTDNNRYAAGQPVIALGYGSLVDSGYTFVGWNTKSNGTGIVYAAGVSFVMDTATVTLYAQWTALPTYTVTYDGNGGTGTPPSDGNHYLSGAIVTVLGNTGGLVKTGNTFVGWNTKTDGTGLSYTSPGTFTMGSANVTLYARWTSNPTYRVTYEGNGSSGGTTPADSNRYLQGQTVVVLANTGVLVKTGFTFAGWDTNALGSGTVYAPGASFIMGTANVTLHAQWAAIPKYTVIYNRTSANSGIGTVPVDTNHYMFGQLVTVLGDTGGLVKTGSTFVGWNTQAGGGGIGYAAGVSFVMGSANDTLYAQWSALPTYTVTYNGNTNTSGNAPVDPNNYLSGTSVTVLGSNTLVKTGYTFVGWDTIANGGGNVIGTSFTMKSTNVTLYAQWTANQTYSVTYFGNDSTGGTVPVDKNNYLSGATVTVRNAGTLVRIGCTFAGWNAQADGKGHLYAPGDTFDITGNVPLYAEWVVTITATAGANGSISPSGTTVAIAGTSITYNITADPNYHIADVQVDGGSKGVITSFTFTNDTTNHTIAATFAITTYTITASTAANGTISPAGISTVNSGTDTTYTITAAPHYHIVAVVVNGTPVGAVTSYTFPNVLRNDTISASFAINTFTINASAGLNGAITPSGAVTVDTGADTTFSITPAVNYHVDSVYVNGLPVTPNTTYTFNSVGADSSISATFAINPLTYYGNGSDGGNPPVDANLYIVGQTVTVLGPGNLSKSGYSFTGWNTDPGGAGTPYAQGDLFTFSVDGSLYAIWQSN